MCNLYNVIIVTLMKEKIKILAAVETPGQKGTKPYFIKNLPSRVEVLEGQTFCFDCYMGRRGCKPWFIKPLPHKIEVWKGRNLEMKCLVGYPTEEHMDIKQLWATTKFVTKRQEGKKSTIL